MAARGAAVVVERAYKQYGAHTVLQDLDMTVERGIIYGLLGPSGCGKTTLLSCIVGRRHLDKGRVWVLGGTPGQKGSGVPGPRVGYMPQELRVARTSITKALCCRDYQPWLVSFPPFLIPSRSVRQMSQFTPGVNSLCIGERFMDIALVGEFSVRDAVFYFARIYGMKTKQMVERFEFLSNLLELPSGGKLIKNCSGGQQRRVSLAAALVHEPELLILDEPTVGLDPVLRERIWEFLSEQARAGTTVIITTHYIDETKQAHKIGLLRDGQLLAEDSPEEILRKFECNTLEDAFLKLALRQHELPPRPHRPALPSVSPDVIPTSSMSSVTSADTRYHSREEFNVVTSSTDVLTKKEEKRKDCKKLSNSRYKAVFIKSIQQFSRHPGGLIFSIMFPIIQVVAFFSAIGHDPTDLHLAVVNDEASHSPLGLNICHNHSLPYTALQEDETCDLFMLSCWFVEEMERKNLFQDNYNTTEEAKHAVLKGKVYGAIHFKRNFSTAMQHRVAEGEVEDDVVSDSSVSVWLDMTNHQISYFLKSTLHKAYEAFTKRTMRACGRHENLVQIPVHFNEPIYGEREAQMTTYMAPGILITIIFFLPAVVTSTLMITDRLEGVWERSAVAGVKPREMLNVHIALQSAIIVMQTVEMMSLAFLGYGIPSKGSTWLVAVLLCLQGLSGMCYGFLLSVYCSSHTVSFFVSTGSFYPMILLCGILWPLEGMSPGLRIFALLLPFTIPSKSLRDILEKGSTITDPGVYIGFLVTVGWIVFTLALVFLRLKLKKS